MEVVIKETNRQPKLELGDIIYFDDEFYLVMDADGAYLAKRFDGFQGLCGGHATLKELNQEFTSRLNNVLHGAVVYKSKDYELHLVKKPPVQEAY